MIVLAVIVFLNIGQESEETMEDMMTPEDLEAKQKSGLVLGGKDDGWIEDNDRYHIFGKDGDNVGTENVNVIDEHSVQHSDEQVAVEESKVQESTTDIKQNNGPADESKEDGEVEVESEEKTSEEESHDDDGETTVYANDSATQGDTTTDDSTEETNEATTKVSTTAPNGGTFTLQRLEATRAAAKSLISLIEEYYNGEVQSRKMMIESWLGPWNFNAFDNDANATEVQRNQVEKLVDTMARALVTEDQTEFLIGTIGSSVAAGHDNCHYDSYESQLERVFSPVWEAAGMKLTCQNAGEGGGCGDDFRNQVYCIKQNVSPKVDIAHYTWTYFEVGGGGDALVARENLIRWSQMLPRQPPVHTFSMFTRPKGLEYNKEYELVERYSKYGYNTFYMRGGYFAGGWDYKIETENGIDRFGWGYVGDGYHNTTRYGENEENPDRKESLGVVMRNWHPGPLAFQFISDAFALTYSKAILLALDLIQKEIANGNDPRDKWDASKRKMLSKKSLPEPKFCGPEYCVVDEAPGCLNFELPTFGQWGSKVEDPNDELNPHKGELQNWEIWHEANDIWHMVGKEDQVIFQDRDDKEICRHLDACGGISATSSDNGMVVFRLPKMEVGLVVICGCCGKDIATEMFINNTNIEVMYNGAVLDPSTWDVFPTNKCVRLLKRFPTEGAAAMNPTGHAYLSIKALGDQEKPVRVSHVITL